MNCDYKLDTSTEIIHGHYDLILEVGKQYEIHYGIHQGVYEYMGRVSENDEKHIHSHGQHMFKNLKTGEITFSYYGYTSPYEFTSIVHSLK